MVYHRVQSYDHCYSFCTQRILTRLWNNMNYHRILCRGLTTLFPLSTRGNTISSRRNAFLHFRYWSVDVIQSSSPRPVKDRVPMVRYLATHPPDRRRFFPRGDVDVKPSQAVRNLGVMMEGNLLMTVHVNMIVGQCFYSLRKIKRIRRFNSVVLHYHDYSVY